METPHHFPCPIISSFAICPDTPAITAWHTLENQSLLFLPGCRKWQCEFCGPRRRHQLAIKIKKARPNRFLTLTTRPHGYRVLTPPSKDDPEKWTADESPRETYDRTRRSISAMFQILRRKHGKIEYFRVLEETFKGYPHYHFLLRSKFIPHHEIRDHWKRLTEAYVIDIQHIPKNERTIKYITKYLTKSQAVTFTNRRICWTRHFFKPEKKTPSNLVGIRTIKNPAAWLANTLATTGLRRIRPTTYAFATEGIPEEIAHYLQDTTRTE